MESSFYQIVGGKNGGCKIFFTDRRMDQFRPKIHEVFDIMNAVDGSYIPKTEDFVSGKYQKIINQIENIKRKTEDCRHKATAARYSLALIEQEILNHPSEEDMKNYSQMIVNKMCDQAELKNDVLIYETESFLFQIKSNIDILIQLLKYIPEYNYLSSKQKKDAEAFYFDNDDAKNNTTNKMKGNGHKDLADLFDKQVIEWLRELNTMRNDIVHRSGLKGFTSYVFDSGSEKVIYPQMPNGNRVDEYCANIFNKLLALYKKIFQDFILPKIT